MALQVTSSWRSSVAEGRAFRSCCGHDGCFPGTRNPRDLRISVWRHLGLFICVSGAIFGVGWDWTCGAFDGRSLRAWSHKRQVQMAQVNTELILFVCLCIAFLELIFGWECGALYLCHSMQGRCSGGRSWSSLRSLHGFGSAALPCVGLGKRWLAPTCKIYYTDEYLQWLL
jgi:hypothetical protein